MDGRVRAAIGRSIKRFGWPDFPRSMYYQMLHYERLAARLRLALKERIDV